MTTPEIQARANIDRLLEQAGWAVQDVDALNVHAACGVAVREFRLRTGHGVADYLLYVGGKAAGVVEAKPVGRTLTGVEAQSEKYGTGLPDNLPAYVRPLPFLYESTGSETRFTNGLDPQPRSRNIFAFHTPETLAAWLGASDSGTKSGVVEPQRVSDAGGTGYRIGQSLRRQLTQLPVLDDANLWTVQAQAIRNLEQSLAEARPRSLVQMATGSGKTFMACNLVYRLIRYAGAKRVLFLVDRSNLGRQTLREFQGFTVPGDGRKFSELYNVQLLQSSSVDPVSKVCIATIQRVYSILRGEELDPEKEEASGFDATAARQSLQTVQYNPSFPIEEFDFIITDECHRSIYDLWRQVLEYFDAFLIGLTATPSKQTMGFFHQNLVMEYNHRQAVADGVNVPYNVYRIETKITEQGSSIEAGMNVDRRDRRTRKMRWEELEEELPYSPGQLDRDVVAVDQIRTVIQTFRDRVTTEIFPGRQHVPKTIIFAKDDSHADDIVNIVREEFGRGNDFCRKITYRTTGARPEDLIQEFRNSFNPRVVVTVDMIATGTDIKPVEVVFFMRNVRSRNFFEQMKGRGVRTISATEFNAVTPDADAKDRFVIVDAVGVTEGELGESYSLDRHPSVPLDKLLDLVAMGNREPDTLSSLASRLARLDRRLSPEDRRAVEAVAGGAALKDLVSGLLNATDLDAALEAARLSTGQTEPSEEAVVEAERQLLEAAARPFAANLELRQRLIEIHRAYEQTIDTTSQDTVIRAEFSGEDAEVLTRSFREYIEEHRDEITALQVLYQRPYRQRLSHGDIRALAEELRSPPRSWTPATLWEAYRRLEESTVRGSSQRVLADVVSLVRYAIGHDEELAPFADGVNERFQGWLAMQEVAGRHFTEEQQQWLADIKDHIAGNVSIEPSDLQYAPFAQRGGIGKAYDLFGDELAGLLEELNMTLAG
ncbi:MAG: DEAD/DEAH box helicase family protein [Chloroflexota bacterium]|nr:DEAD/DEAH box helicase family protein [Chloroflexota bacterium]